MSVIDVSKRSFCDNCDKTTDFDVYPCDRYEIPLSNYKKIILCEDCMIELYLGMKRLFNKEGLWDKVREREKE